MKSARSTLDRPLDKKSAYSLFFPRSLYLFLSLFFLLALVGCSDERPTINIDNNISNKNTHQAKQVNQKPTLRVAVGAMISPEITREYYQKMMELIAERVGRRAIFSQRRTYAEINELVKKHEVDIAFVCAGPYTNGHAEFGMELLVTPEAHGKNVYHSYIIVHRDSKIQSFTDLRGKRFAFTDPHSNTGSLVPTYMLSKRGESPETFFSETFYTNSHDNSIKAVADGLADGAAVDSLIWEFIDAVSPEDTSRTKIIEKSPPYGIPPIVVHPDLDNNLKQQLKSVFLSLHEDKEAASLLKQIQIDQFSEGDDSMYDSVREMQKWVKKFNKGKNP